MKLVWSRRALSDLDEIQGFIAGENSRAAVSVANRLVALTDDLLRFPKAGYRHQRGFRELVDARYGYVIRYRLVGLEGKSDTILILSLQHPKRNRA